MRIPERTLPVRGVRGAGVVELFPCQAGDRDVVVSGISEEIVSHLVIAAAENLDVGRVPVNRGALVVDVIAVDDVESILIAKAAAEAKQLDAAAAGPADFAAADLVAQGVAQQGNAVGAAVEQAAVPDGAILDAFHQDHGTGVFPLPDRP